DRAADDDQEEHGEQHDPPGDAPALAVAGRAVLVVVEVVVAGVGDDRLELGGVGAAPGPAAGVGLRRVGGAGPGLGAPLGGQPAVAGQGRGRLGGAAAVADHVDDDDGDVVAPPAVDGQPHQLVG